ncbi:DUF1615 domain-containing protein [Lysobacter koreensis]|uniref:DUF1615 domain-containing protein n=1 Tax=Lysobacter koreensis TaxID=266122 RepID=A0ABW2YPP0_9GAMM
MMARPHRARTGLLGAALALLAACSAPPPPPDPAEVRARLLRLLPATLADRNGWATDIQGAFAALEIRPVTPNLCAALAVIEQETGYDHDPVVPGLATIARAEIDRRADRLNVPRFVVRAALAMTSPNGQRYDARLAAVRTEQDLNRIYEEFVESVPMGRRLLGGANPVRTGGPMQVSIVFAERHAQARPYPYPAAGSIRQEVLSRRGGVYFGIAHLLGYPTSYPRLLYRFADFNAGLYASRNAAFQSAVSVASGIPLELDGDLLQYGSDRADIGPTEVAVRTLAPALGLSTAQVNRALQESRSHRFEQSALYEAVFALADRQAGAKQPRAVMPRIRLHSPKITRKLTTQWFATRVEKRYRGCMARAASG